MSKKTRRQRRVMIEPLEPRLLFSATTDALLADDFSDDAAYMAHLAENTDLTEVYALQSDAPDTTDGTDDATPPLDAPTSTETRQNIEEIIFIDTAVEDYQALLDDILANKNPDTVKVFLLDSDTDGIDQISETLTGYSGVTAVHLISHGGDGKIALGATELSQSNVNDYTSAFGNWQAALSGEADILIYGCDVAASEAGLNLLQQLGELTQADIAASDDLTGHQSWGGDWELEYQRGTVEAEVTVSEALQASWDNVLAETIYITSGTPDSSTIITSTQSAGQTFTYTSGSGAYDVNQISVQLINNGAASQTITVTLTNAWTGGTVLGMATLSSDAIGASFSQHNFNFTGVTLTDGATYYIKVTSDGTDGLVSLGYDSSAPYADGQYVYDSGTTEANRDLAFQVSYISSNTAPVVANPIPDQTTQELDPFSYIIPADTFSDADGDKLTYSATLADGSALPPWLNFDAATRELSGTADDGDVGSYSIEITATDGNGGSVSDTFGLTVNNLEEAPTSTDATASTDEDVPYTLSRTDFSFADQDVGDSLAGVRIDTLPTQGALTLSGVAVTAGQTISAADLDAGNLIFTPDANESGASYTSFTFSVGDSTGLYDTAPNTWTIDVASVNDAPTITSDGGGATASIDVQSGQTAVTTVTTTDADGDIPTYRINSGADASRFTINSTTGELVFKQPPDFNVPRDSDANNTYEVEVLADDGVGGITTQLITVTVLETNAAPAGTDGTVVTNEDTAYNFALTDFGFTDANAGDTLSAVRIDTLPTNGALTLSGSAVTAGQVISAADITSGNLIFTPTADANGAGYTSFTFSVRDSSGLYDTAPNTLTIDVTAVNDAPTITSGSGATAAVNAAENQTAVTTVTASDIEGDAPTFSISGGADAALFSVNTTTGELTYISAPNFENATDADTDGIYEVQVTASDGNGGTDVQAISVTVTDVNDAPVITSGGGTTSASYTAAENQTAVTTIVAADGDGDLLSYSISGGTDAAFFSIDANGVLTFTSAPDYENALDANGDGVYEVEVTTSDASLSDTQLVSVTVTNASDDIEYIDTGSGGVQLPFSSTNHVGQSFSYDSTGATYNVNQISIELARYASTNPQTITVELRDAWSGAILGSASISSDAVSDTGFEWHSFKFSDVALNDNQTYYIRISTDGSDDGVLVRYWDSDQVPGAMIENGVANAFGWDLAFKLSEEDGFNTAPTVANPIANQTLYEDVDFNWVVPADTFADADPNDTLTYRAQLAGGGSLDWLVFNEITRTFWGTPRNDDLGTMTVELIATDNHGASTSTFFDLNILNTNDDPFVRFPLVDHAVTEDSAFNYTVPADYFGDDDADAVLSYSATLADGSPLPAWLTFDAATRTFSGIPTNNDVGTVSIEVTVQDENGASVTDTFGITITNTNDAPVLASPIAGQSTSAGTAFSFQLSVDVFTDVDAGDLLMFSAQQADGQPLPNWLMFDAATRTFSGTPTVGDLGTVSIEVAVDDSNGGTATTTFDLIVTGNSAPTSNGVADITNVEDASDDSVSLFAAFDDLEDSDEQLQYAVIDNSNTALISGATIDPVSGRLQLEYGTDQYGTGTITLQATDRSGVNVTTSFAVNITPVNDMPVAVGNEPAGVIMDTVTTATGVNFLNAFFDVEDGSNMTYTVVGNSNPAIAQIVAVDSEAGTFIFSHNGSLDGTTSVTIRATDSEGAWVERSLMVQVQKAAAPQPAPADPTTPQSGNDDEQETPAENEGGEKPPAAENPNTEQEPAPGPPPTDDDASPLTPSLDPLVKNLGAAPTSFDYAEFDYEPVQSDRRYEPPQDHDENVEQQMRELAAVSQNNLISLTTSPSGYLNEQDLTEFEAAIDRARETMSEAYEEEQRRQHAVAAVTVSFTTGLIIWSLRASSLLLTLFSMLPLWKGIDPLPVLENVKKRRKQLEQQRRDKLQEDSSAREVGYLFDQPKTPRQNK